MPALNFKKRFAADVEAGRKLQTLRSPRRDGRPHATIGCRLYLYTGMRTKGCRKLGEGLCTKTSHVVITDALAGSRILVNGSRVIEEDAFARADGFADSGALLEWFREEHGLPFEGSLIQWKLDRKESDMKKGQPYGVLIPITQRHVPAPAAYERLMWRDREDLSMVCYDPIFASLVNRGEKAPTLEHDMKRIADLMWRIRWRAELRDDYTPARGWGDCDSKVTRGIEEFLLAGWPRGALRMVFGQVRGPLEPIWHAVLSVWWKDGQGRYCAVLDPRYRRKTSVPAAGRRVFMQYIETPRAVNPLAIIGPDMTRPAWAAGRPLPVRGGRHKVTLDDLFKQAVRPP